MKAKSKILALLLSLVMVFGLMVPAFAADDKADDTDAKTEVTESAEPEESGPVESEPAASEAPAEAQKIVILHTNDVHCGIDQVKKDDKVTNIGYAGLAAYKTEMEAEYGKDNVTLIDAGDAIQGETIGNLTDGEYIVKIMNEVGYDLAIPGNHEFDFKVPNFLDLANKTAKYDYLCCNFMDLKTNKSAFDGYKVVSYGDVKVGYVGISTPETFTSSTPTYFQDGNGKFIYSFSEGNEGKTLYTAVQNAVDAAKKDGADYVVAIGHLGVEVPSDPYSSTSVIANTTGIDVFIDGHSHTVVPGDTKPNKDGEDVIVNQTGTKLANIGKIVIDAESGEITAELVSGYDKQDEAVAATIKGMWDEFDELLSEVIGETEAELTGSVATDDTPRLVRSQETNTGDLAADAYRVVMGTDIAFMNGGGIRANVPVGKVTYKDIVDILPFSNSVCTMEVSGQVILDALEWGAKDAPNENGGFLQVSGLTYTIDTTIPTSVTKDDKGFFASVSGERRVKDVKVGGEDIDPDKTYTLAGHNYMLKDCGDGYTMFAEGKLIKDEVMMQSQTLIDYIKGELKGTIPASYAEPAGRITVVLPAEPEPEPEPEPTPEPEPEPQPEGTYTVVRGDCLSKIAKTQYGDSSKWTVIYEANKGIIKDPNQIWPGQVLLIPAA